MRPVEVDGYALGGFAEAVAGLATRLEQATGTLVALPAHPDVAALAQPWATRLALGRELLLTRLRSLARVVLLARRAYRTVEDEVAASFVGPARMAEPAVSADNLLDLLGLASADQLEALLVASPALAMVVVDEPGRPPGGSDADQLDALLAGGAAQVRVHEFLVGLDGDRLARLALLHPALLCRVPSAPVAARCRAARVLVAADLDVLLTRRAALPVGSARRQVDRQIAQRREWLTGTVEVRDAQGRVVRRRHQLLDFSSKGDGQVVELLGDARRARHLAVFVPGTGSDLEREPGSVDRLLPFVRADPGLAVVLWQGADFPDQPFDDGFLPLRRHVLAAGYRDAADVAGPALARDVAGLRLSMPQPADDLTVLGHSYGGSIVGAAQVHGLVADRVVHIASAGAFVSHVAPGGTSAPRVFSMTAPDDPIQLAQGYGLRDAASRWRAMSPRWLVPAAPVVGGAVHLVPDGSAIGHGLDPDRLPGVVRLDTGRFDDSCRLVRGHTGVFAPGTTAWRNLLATMDGGRVEVLEPSRWRTHLEPAGIRLGGGGAWLPRYVVDRTPWSDPTYRPPTLDVR
ncbi:alpha/beta hydrolase [Angustibacter sp. McL0619]|uniref:alpha/beta hydrolase n=1 Tax=Angustibacter sp. McL0619 TaxID=3415676 RepID=UPI003CEEF0E9